MLLAGELALGSQQGIGSKRDAYLHHYYVRYPDMDFGRWVPTQIDGFGSGAATGVSVGSYSVVWVTSFPLLSIARYALPGPLVMLMGVQEVEQRG